MNILIVGTGIIETIYDWALHNAGIDLTDLVRSPKPELGNDDAKNDILDKRKGYLKYNQTTYPIGVCTSIEKEYDLFIVPTNWNQTETADEYGVEMPNYRALESIIKASS